MDGVSTGASYTKPQRGHRFRPSEKSPNPRRGPDCQWRLPWELGTHVEQFQHKCECLHQHPPHVSLVGQPPTRNVHYARSLSHFDTDLIRTAVAVDLFPSSNCTLSRENIGHSRQTKLSVNVAIRICPQLLRYAQQNM